MTHHLDCIVVLGSLVVVGHRVHIEIALTRLLSLLIDSHCGHAGSQVVVSLGSRVTLHLLNDRQRHVSGTDAFELIDIHYVSGLHGD